MADNKKHLEEECPNEFVECQIGECTDDVKRKDLENHKTKTCPWIKKKCDFCEFQAIDIEMEEHHNSECPEITIDCDHRCILKHQRKFTELHQRYSCARTKHDCYFRNAGCYYTATWKEIGEHANDAQILHAVFLEQKLKHFEEYKKETQLLIDQINKKKDYYHELLPFIQKIENTEEIYYPMFTGNFFKQYSHPNLVFDESLKIVSSKPGMKNQLLFIDRQFHEKNKIVFNLLEYEPKENKSCISFGITKKGKRFEEQATCYSSQNHRDYRLFYDGLDQGYGQTKFKFKKDQDYVFSFDSKEEKIILEELNADSEDKIATIDFPNEFFEWQPVFILSENVKVQLVDFNDWS